MSKKVLLLTIAVLLITAVGIFFFKNSTLNQKDITGWQKLTWGMTQAQVSKHYKLGPWQDSGGIACATLTEQMQLVGSPFTVYLYFSEKSDNGRLTEILLMGEGPTAKLLGLPELYANQYGPPSKADTATPMKNWSWDRESARLMLMIIPSPEEEPDPMDMEQQQPLPDDKANCSIRYISALKVK